MEIRGEANVFKLELAKDLKQIAEKVVIGKSSETNTTNVKIEDNRKLVSLTFNFIVTPSTDPQQVEDIAKRFKSVFLEQAEVVGASGDSTFATHVEHKIPLSPILNGTAEALVVENRDYLIEGKGKPKFITDFKNLPSVVFVAPPKGFKIHTKDNPSNT